MTWDALSSIYSTRDGPYKTGSVTIGNEGGHADVQLEKILYQKRPATSPMSALWPSLLAHCWRTTSCVCPLGVTRPHWAPFLPTVLDTPSAV